MIAVALFAITGLVLGLAHFAALRWMVDGYLNGTRNVIAWYLARLAGSSVALFVLVRLGGTRVLATLIGVVIARSIAVHVPAREAT